MEPPEEFAVTDLLPHRPPMLLVDRVLSLSATACEAVKNISYAEPCFQGHFPGAPIFPGVLTLEALGQTCALCLHRDGGARPPIFAGVSAARFLRPVRPGDRLRLSVRLSGTRRCFHTFQALARVGGQVVCEAELTIYREEGV